MMPAGPDPFELPDPGPADHVAPAQPGRCALHGGKARAACPRCDGKLLAFSPSGNGTAACDECSTFWDICPCCTPVRPPAAEPPRESYIECASTPSCGRLWPAGVPISMGPCPIVVGQVVCCSRCKRPARGYGAAAGAHAERLREVARQFAADRQAPPAAAPWRLEQRSGRGWAILDGTQRLIAHVYTEDAAALLARAGDAHRAEELLRAALVALQHVEDPATRTLRTQIRGYLCGEGWQESGLTAEEVRADLREIRTWPAPGLPAAEMLGDRVSAIRRALEIPEGVDVVERVAKVATLVRDLAALDRTQTSARPCRYCDAPAGRICDTGCVGLRALMLYPDAGRAAAGVGG